MKNQPKSQLKSQSARQLKSSLKGQPKSQLKSRPKSRSASQSKKPSKNLASKVVVLINLGTPQSPSVPDVRKYLYEFLMDPCVIDLSKTARRILVGGIIAPFRSFSSSRSYKEIWQNNQSPLLAISETLRDTLQKDRREPIFLAMRYGKPSIPAVIHQALTALKPKGTLQIIPLYPHHAMSTTLTVYRKVQETLAEAPCKEIVSAKKIKTTFEAPFYTRESYLKALCQSIAPHTKSLIKKSAKPKSLTSRLGGSGQEKTTYDHILFSYHGTPIRHLTKVDRHNHCTRTGGECCAQTGAPSHTLCYRHQVLATTHSVIRRLNLNPMQVSTSFQSRLGTNWLRPYTDQVIQAMPAQGIRRLLVVTPAFVSDNLETLFEISIENEELFRKAGGERLTLIPCLNIEKPWIHCLNELIDQSEDFTSELHLVNQTFETRSDPT